MQIHTAKPDPLIPNKCSLFTGLMLPAGYCQEKGLDYLAEHPIGCGPYKFVSWTRDNEIVLEAYDEYVGVIMVVNLCIGMLTPPLGANLFVAMRIGGITLEEALKEAMPVILVEILILAIMILCPWLITFLPNLLM